MDFKIENDLHGYCRGVDKTLGKISVIYGVYKKA